MKIGITGGNGFIGQHLYSFLKKHGHTVSIFDYPKNNLFQPDEKRLKKFVTENKVIIHTAAVNRGSNTDVVAGSIVITYNLISSMERNKSNAKIIFLSSIQAETDSLYGKSKVLTEIMLEDFSKRTKLPVSIFRLTNVFGDGGKPFYNSVVATFCFQTLNDKKLKVNEPLREMNLIYINDVVKKMYKEILKNREKLFIRIKVNSANVIKLEELANLVTSFKIIDNAKKFKSEFHKDLYRTFLSYKLTNE